MAKKNKYVFPKKLEKMRESQGISRKELARRCGLSEGYIAVLEREERIPSIETAKLICKELKTDLNDLCY